jgi:cyclic beta-1,2-glucan synthetase
MILNKEQLSEEAHKSALTHDPIMIHKPSKYFWRAYESDLENLRTFVNVLREKCSSCSQPSEEWLLDNAEFLEEQNMNIKNESSTKFINTLPQLKNTRESRVFSICSDFVNYTDGNLNMDSFISYIHSYQEISVLKIAEVWAIPLLLKCALIRYLSKIMRTLRERHDICMLVSKMLSGIQTSELSPETLKKALEDSGQEMPLSGPLIVHLVKHLRERADFTATLSEWLMCKLENGPESFDQILSYEYQVQADFQVMTGNIIGSLRKLSRWDWQEIFEQISMVEQTLQKENTGSYTLLDFSSRNTIRRRIEHLAHRLNLPENLVASKAVELTEEYINQKTDNDVENIGRKSSVAYYLLEPDGIKMLRQSLKMCGKPRIIPEAGLLKHKTGTYFNSLAVLFLIFLIGFSLWIGGSSFETPFEWIVIFCVLLIPSMEWAVTVTHWLIERLKKPIPLLRYDFSKGIPSEATTMVVIPVIWSTVDEVTTLTDRLEMHYLANRDPNIHFAILGDFVDSETENHEQDQSIICAAKEEINRLDRTYPESSFHLFQRKRQWNPSEEIWMGWERKRGKLVEFVELLKGSKNTSFTIIDGESSFFDQIRYIITLDADTILPLESASRMIGTMHLPFNRPKLNDQKTRVISGYGVLQPRIGMSHEAAMRSRLATLWSGDPGIDPYAFAVSDPYQDGFGQGIFTGKGIFDVDTFYQLLCERIPENRVLSHDLLEGGFLRAGLLSDIELVDDHPARFIASQKRQHRWVRGDWQLILWLFPRMHNRGGESVPVDLSVLTKWQIFDNLRRSLLSPILFATLLLSFMILPGSPFRWIALVFATLCLPVFRQIVTVQTILRNTKSILFTIGQVMVTIVTLPFQIIVLLDGICRSLYRLFYSKRHLLEWVTSAEVDRNSTEKGNPPLYGMYRGYALIALFLAVSFLNQNVNLQMIGYVISALWVFAPFIINWLDQPSQPKTPLFTNEEKEELKTLSRQIWDFYEDNVLEQENWLPPDNVQIHPPNGVAHRTSPTNIGLYLTCALAAKDFEFIDLPGLVERLERTLITIEKMEKWEGHLYNWYDTETLKPLTPMYVSTVDSGNFVGCLITVKEGLSEWLNLNNKKYDRHEPIHQEKMLNIAFSEEIAPGPPRDIFHKNEQLSLETRIKKLIDRFEKLGLETNFRPLYDHKAKLFSLGYNEERRERDVVLYDLMASEARQASFIAIALGQVSVSHWHVLGRTMAKAGKIPVLLSWSGTMFEFLMPSLFMKTYRNTLWESTYKAVVNRQIEYAKQRKVPFGISESGYYAFDFQMNYQYRAFGVPGLGFKRGLEKDLVVAPYATILAMPFAKQESLETLKNMEKLNGRGKYGFYEAIDFTKGRLPEDKKYMVISSFMAHHQGMSFLTLANLLLQNKMYDRFHRNKQIRSAELLLQERIPNKSKFIEHYAMSRLHEPFTKCAQDTSELREYLTPDTNIPEVCVLSNGSFTTVITNSGSGLSLYKGLAVSRWREDSVMDSWGSYIYIRDISKDIVWSPSYQPCRIQSSEHRVHFGLDHASFMQKVEDVKASMEICVSTEWNAEIRRITLTNTSEDTKVLEVTTYVELALANPIADDAHTAFSKLFIRTDFDRESECLVAGRRTREEKDHPLWAAHSLIVDGETLGSVEYDTDRSSFIGRGFRLSEPKEIRTRLRGRVGSVADPAFVMRRRISINPGEQIQLMAVTAVSESKEEAIEIISRFNQDQLVERAFQLAWNRGQIELRNLHLNNHEATDFQKLAGQILYSPPLRNEREDCILANTKGQSGLWSFGISGDRPVMLVRVDNRSQMPFIIKMLSGHEYLRRLGILFDLILLNESEEGYQQNLQEGLQHAAEQGVDRFGAGLSGIFVIAANQLAEPDKALLMSVSRVILRAGGASLKAQLRIPKLPSQKTLPDNLVPKSSLESNSNHTLKENTKEWLYFNGWGGFSSDGKEYQILIKNGNYLPAPWINVLANPNFGCLISEMGTGYTWWRNSRECKLTPWSNDPVLDPPTETAFLRDEESGEVWSLAPSATPTHVSYKITHGRGFTQFEHERNGIKHEMLVYVPLQEPVKIIRLKLQNETSEPRKMSATYYAEWVLGVKRHSNSPYIVTRWDDSAKVMTARNTYQEVFRDATAFLGIFGDDDSLDLSWTADRTEFIGRNRTMEHPAAMDREELSGRTGTFNETCGAIQGKFTLMPNSEKVIYILLGCNESDEAVLNLIKKYNDASNCEIALKDVLEFWDLHLNQIQVATPSKEMDILLNGWLLYQSLACRIWARSAFYQAGGAYGFRDQLQDSLSLLHNWPDRTREQILLHAAHQYEEGDVQHWWHEETHRGIRTMFSDDLLWLPYVVSRYIEHTGDLLILEEVVPFLHSGPLQEGELERYEPTQISDEKGTIYQHCLRAIDKALSRIGEHGLPLMGVGDWNDGMNNVGAKGRGESVWLGWFICDVLKRFKELCQLKTDTEKEDAYQKAYDHLADSLNKYGWDGQWYRRAFTDEGDWLGSIQNEECRIDAIAQSWSVISGAAPKDRAVQAMISFDRELVERELSVIRLLTPAFDETEPSPGYIQGYPPGIRENGAQYTHGVIWGIVACCNLGQGDKAMEMFTLLNPLTHTRTDRDVRKYMGEPYVMAADVYTAPPNEGRAGWTWYTGAAGWMYQAGMEWILGLRRRGNLLYIDPCIPSDWPGYSVTYRFGSARYFINVKNGNLDSETSIKVDGKITILMADEVASVPLQDDGQDHQVDLTLNK